MHMNTEPQSPTSPPLVSVIMPTYNAAEYIGAAIQSVIDQTYTHWELIIVDDGSTDETAKIVEPFLHDARVQSVGANIRYIQQENKGQPKTRNNAVRMSGGSLIAWLDADDAWKPTKLEKQVAIFEKYPDVGVCGTAMELIRPNGEVFSIPNVKPDFYGRAVPDLVTRKFFVAMSASVTRKEIFDKIGYFDEGFLPFSMDYDFWLRASLVCMFYSLGEVLLQYRMGHPSISQKGSDKRLNLVMYTVVPRFVKEYGGGKYVKWYHIWQLHGWSYYCKAMEKTKWREKTYWLLRALSCNPLHWDSLANLAQQFLPRRLYNTLKSLVKK